MIHLDDGFRGRSWKLFVPVKIIITHVVCASGLTGLSCGSMGLVTDYIPSWASNLIIDFYMQTLELCQVALHGSVNSDSAIVSFKYHHSSILKNFIAQKQFSLCTCTFSSFSL